MSNAETPEHIELLDPSQFSVHYGEPDETGNRKATIHLHVSPEQAKNILKMTQKESGDYSVGWVIAKPPSDKSL